MHNFNNGNILSSFLSVTIATSYLPFITDRNIDATEIMYVFIPITSGSKTRVKIGKDKVVITCAKKEPEVNNKIDLKKELFLNITINSFN